MLKHIFMSLAACGLAVAAESFENLPAGAFTEGKICYGSLSAEGGHAEIVSDAVKKGQTKKAKSGLKALRLTGGKNHSAELALDEPLADAGSCNFWVQRWTAREPFKFVLTAVTPQGEKQLFADKSMKVGGYKKRVDVVLPPGTTALRFACDSPGGGGALLDDLSIHSGPMELKSVQGVSPGAYPVLKRAPINPVAAVLVKTEGVSSPLPLDAVKFKLDNPGAVGNVTLRTGNASGTSFSGSVVFGAARPSDDGTVTINCGKPLRDGDNWLWVDVTPSESAQVGDTVTVSDVSVEAEGKTYDLAMAPVTQRIGYLLSVPGEEVAGQADGGSRACKAFRIPGLIRTQKGSLVGVFDARYNHAGDLCADIDVAVVRSTDGGRTWTPPTVAMDAGPGADNGCGDPCILQDAGGRIWLQALACHFSGGASLAVSQKGFDPRKTGQWEMTYSDDDGKTWSKSIVNPTDQIKKEEWHCILAGPGCGIVTKEGVIVFPAQIWQRDEKINCKSTICYSKDGGKTWKYGNGVPHRTSECQVVELSDGSLMLNCRNEARSGKRVVYVTKDLGETWQPHESNLKALVEPTCQASIVSVKHAGRNLLLFSNPKNKNGRDHMSIRVSKDDGLTWNEGYEYDSRPCWGYSCIAMADSAHVGIMYEAPHVSETSEMHGIAFLRIPLETVLKGGGSAENGKKKAK